MLGFWNLTPGSKVGMSLNGCENVSKIFNVVAAFMFLQLVLKGH